MDEDELRTWVREQLRQEVPDSIWTLVREDGYLNVVDEAERDDLVRRIARLLQLMSSKPMRKRRRSVGRNADVTLKPLLTARESLRAQALTEYFGKLAGATPELQRFRAQVLDGQLLTKDGVKQLLLSPVARMLSIEDFRRWQIPLIHEGRIVSEIYEAGKTYEAVLYADPPGATVPFSQDLAVAGTFWERLAGNQIISVRIDGMRHETTVFDGSILDALRRTGLALKTFPWQDGESLLFALTGNIPSIAPMSSSMKLAMSSHSDRARIQITADPWVSAASVARMFGRAQKQLLARHNRPISERRLELFRFVTANQQDLEIPPWRGLMENWNKKFRSWRYDDVRNFSRDYWSAARGLLFPQYDFLAKGKRSK